MMSHQYRRVLFGFLVPLGLLAVSVIYGACTPGSELTAAESDIVITLYDTDFNFGSVKTFSMPDTIYAITEESLKASEIDYADQRAILDLVASKFEDRGYQLVDVAQSPDFAVMLTEQQVDYWNLYSWVPWYPWYGGGWWWYYPPATGVSYAFSTGTLYVQMGDFDEAPSDPEKAPDAHWYASMNGITNDTKSNVRRRVTDSINQAFDQSPYLKTK